IDNGATSCAELTSYTYGVGATLPIPAKTGYTFGGWYDNSSFTGSAVTEILTTDTGAKTFYAKWTANTYAVTLNTNGATSCAELTSYTYGVGATLPTPTKKGYTFGGWYENSSLSGSKVTSISTTDIGDKVYYAKWTIVTYNITYYLNGGNNAASNPTTYKVTTATITLADATKTGYTFGGWYSNSSFTGSKVTKIAKGSTGNKTLYAKWTARTDIAYTVKHYLQNVTGSGYTLDATENLTGTTNTTVNAVVRDYEHFNYNSSKSTVSGTVAGDGSLILSVYYDRETYTFSVESHAHVTSVTGEGTYRYGQTVDIKAWLEIGYDYLEWYIGDMNLFGGDYEEDGDIRISSLTFDSAAESTQKVIDELGTDITFHFVVYAATDTKYTVNYYYMNTSGNFPSAATEIETLKGLTDTTATVIPKTVEGFTFNKTRSTVEGVIKGNGSLVLKLYYNRNKYNVGLGMETSNGAVNGGGSKYYGSDTTITATPNDTYAFDGWYNGLTLVSEDATYTFTVTGNITLNARWKFVGGDGVIGRQEGIGTWSYHNTYGDLCNIGGYGASYEFKLNQSATLSETQFIYLSFGKDQNTIMTSGAVGEGYFAIQIIIPEGNNNMYMTVYDHNATAVGSTDIHLGTLTNGTDFGLTVSTVITNNGMWYLIIRTSTQTYIDDMYFNAQIGGSFVGSGNKINPAITNYGSGRTTVSLCGISPQTVLYPVIPTDAVGGVMNSGAYRTSWTYSDVKGGLLQVGAYGVTYEFGARLAGELTSTQYAYVSFGPDTTVLQPTTDGSGAQSKGHFIIKFMINNDMAYPRLFMSLIGNNGKTDDILGGLADVSIGAIATDSYLRFKIGFVQGGNGIWYLSFLYNGETILDGVVIGDNVFNNNIGSAFMNGSNQTNFSIINPKDTKIDFVCFGYEKQTKQYSVLPAGVVGGLGVGNTQDLWSYYDEKGSLYQAGTYGVIYDLGIKLESGAHNGKKIYLSVGPDGTVLTPSSTSTAGHFLLEFVLPSSGAVTLNLLDNSRNVLFSGVTFGTLSENDYYRFKIGFMRGTDDGWYLTLENEFFITQDGQYFNENIGGAFLNDNYKTNVALIMGTDVYADVAIFGIEFAANPFSVPKGGEGKYGTTTMKQTNSYSGVDFAAVTPFASMEEIAEFENMVVNSDGSVNNGPQETAIKRSTYYETKVQGSGDQYGYIESYTIAVAQKKGGDTAKTTKPHTIVYLEVAENRIASGVRLQIKNNAGNVSSAKILPETLKVSSLDFYNEYIYFTVHEYGAYTLIVDDSYEKPLTVFVRKPELLVVPEGYTVIKYSPDTVSVKAADSDVYVPVTDNSRGTKLQTGLWEIGTELISYHNFNAFGSKTIVYVEKGTILVPKSGEGETFGALLAAANRGTTDIKFMGHGIIDMSRLDKAYSIVSIYANNINNFELNGLTLLNCPTWTVDIEECENVRVEDVIIFGYRTNSDGICINSCRNAIVKNCFARSGDDLFEVKTSSSEARHILFENCVAWADMCRAFGIIQETMRDINDVTYRNCYLLYQLYAWFGRSEPDESVPITDTYMAAMVVSAGEQASVYNVTFENCIVNYCCAYAVHISVGQNKETWVGDDRVSPDNFQNYAKNIVFKNCRIKDVYDEDFKPMLDPSENPKYFRYYNNTADEGAITAVFDGFKINDSLITSKSIMKDYTVYHANANEGIYDYITVK
ncbi:MAG: InlB B-repeat-containing protein, partial [Clostridia bacterium]|nr:InlB B-repeat-containing protein [Clostridia bacterium]